MKRMVGSVAPVAVAALLAFVAGSGCEDEPSTRFGVPGTSGNNPFPSIPRSSAEKQFDVEASVTTITMAGQTLSLRVLGGIAPFVWTASETVRGTVQVSANTAFAVYRANVVAPNTVTVRDATGQTLTVFLASGAPGLQIVPASVQLTADEPYGAPVSLEGWVIQFRANGGIPPYGAWQAGSPALGTIVGNTGVYTVHSGGVGENIVSITDGAGDVATVTVTTRNRAAGEIPVLQIVPSSITLTAAETNGVPSSIEGQQIQFRVAGGVPPYGAWAASIPGQGTIVPATGLYTAHAAGGVGANTVSISDRVGKIATATVTIQYGR
jgi:hypothetical protein